jgi:hypothetical protein
MSVRKEGLISSLKPFTAGNLILLSTLWYDQMACHIFHSLKIVVYTFKTLYSSVIVRFEVHLWLVSKSYTSNIAIMWSVCLSFLSNYRLTVPLLLQKDIQQNERVCGCVFNFFWDTSKFVSDGNFSVLTFLPQL